MSMSNRFRVVGYLVPSGTGKSYKVVLDGKFVGLIPREALVRSLQAMPMLVVEISKFVDQPFEPSEQRTLNSIAVADPEKLKISEADQRMSSATYAEDCPGFIPRLDLSSRHKDPKREGGN